MNHLNKVFRKDTKCKWPKQARSALDHLKNALILLYPNRHNPYTLSPYASNYAYSDILIQTVDGPDDLRPIAYTSHSFSDMQQSWPATEKESFCSLPVSFKVLLLLKRCIMYTTLLSSRTIFITLHENTKINCWSMDLSGYIVTFVHVEGSNKIIEDVIS